MDEGRHPGHNHSYQYMILQHGIKVIGVLICNDFPLKGQENAAGFPLICHVSVYVQNGYVGMCVTCTWRSVCDPWGHAVSLYAMMGQWNQVMVA